MRNTPGLPSWVPDYDTKGGRPSPLLALNIGDCQNEFVRFRATASLSRQLQFPPTEAELCISGHKVDNVSRTAGSNDDHDVFGGQFIDWLDLVLSLPETYLTSQPRTDVF